MKIQGGISVQSYNRNFAQAYNQECSHFARRFAPRIQEVYERTPLGTRERTLLDVCCGTGQLAVHFLEQG